MDKKKALIVDDSKLALFVLKKMLVELGLDVDTLLSAEEALVYLEDQHPDIIFLDHNMPGMNGLEALSHIKNNSALSTIPVMMYTSKEDQAYIEQARELGASEVLPKQMKSLQLRNVLDMVELLEQTKPSETSEQIQHAHSIRSEKDELAKLVEDAEEVFEKETLKQSMTNHFEHVQTQLISINDSVKHSDEYDNFLRENKRYKRLIIAMFAICFSLLGYAQYRTYTQLSHLTDKAENLLISQSIIEIPILEAFDEERITQTNNTNVENDITGLLDLLAQNANSTKETTENKPLLNGDIRKHILDWLLPLNTVGYRGVVDITIHTGRFCLTSNKKAALVLPKAKTLASNCQITDYDFGKEKKAYEDLVKLIDDINNDRANSFRLNVSRSDKNLAPYPDRNTTLTAGEWNRAAQQNHRVVFSFR